MQAKQPARNEQWLPRGDEGWQLVCEQWQQLETIFEKKLLGSRKQVLTNCNISVIWLDSLVLDVLRLPGSDTPAYLEDVPG